MLVTCVAGPCVRAARVAVGMICWALAAQAAFAQAPIRITGTGSGIGSIRLVADAFMRAHPELRVEVLPAIGSVGAIKALLAGKIEIALSNREPNAAEQAAVRLQATEYAHTPFVVAVHKDVGVAALTSAQLAALYAPGATFATGVHARPVLRLTDAADTVVLRSISPEVAQALEAATRSKGMLNAATDSAAADLIQSSPGVFGGCTLAMIASERRPLAALVLDGRVPSVDNLVNGSYPYFKRLIAVVQQDPAPPVARFVAFLRSAEAQAILRAHGNLPR